MNCLACASWGTAAWVSASSLLFSFLASTVVIYSIQDLRRIAKHWRDYTREACLPTTTTRIYGHVYVDQGAQIRLATRQNDTCRETKRNLGEENNEN
ncbi:hypothetical protein BJ166DRAFT_311704 [Pestalotiopsis sp. NC0098]|nr:hypothetical protein BJ166DRAFT_311704 [Pestalotiopsis sp. NC0098]